LPYGSEFTSDGVATTSPFTPTISPAIGAGTGPTHFPLSTVPALWARARIFPTAFGRTTMMVFARFCATSVIPIRTRPSASSRAHTCFSTK